jgi:hypothetical protein
MSKLDKYLTKLLTSTSENNGLVYLDKINQYGTKMSGGTVSGIQSTLDSALSQNFQLITTDRNVTKYFPATSDCDDVKELFSGNDDDTEEIRKKYNILCTKNIDISDTRKMSYSEVVYLFKKNFNIVATDTFNGKTLDIATNAILTNYIFTVLDYCIKAYISDLIAKNVFGAKTQYLHGNVELLYKGGNTTRCLFGCFIRSFDKTVRNSGSSNGWDKLYKLWSESGIGDWDYNVYIKYDKLEKLGFSEGELTRIYNEIINIIHIALIDTREKFLKIFYSTQITNDFTKNMQKIMFSGEFKLFIDKFVQDYNNVRLPGFAKLEYLGVDNIEIPGKLIKINSAEDIDNYRELRRLNIINQPNPRSVLGSASKIVMPTSTPIVDIAKRIVLGENLVKSNASNFYIINLTMQKRLLYTEFHLVRQKMTCVTQLKGKFEGKNEQLYKVYSMIEVIDVTCASKNDNKLHFVYKYLPNHDNIMVELNTRKSEKLHYGMRHIKIPSAEYMFGDIACILFDEAVFLWEGQKLEKRLKRLNMLAFMSLFNGNDNMNQILLYYNTMHSLFTLLKTKTTIAAKYDVIKNEFDVVATGFAQGGIIPLPEYDIEIKPTSRYNVPYLKHALVKYIKNVLMSMYIIDNKLNSLGEYNVTAVELNPSRAIELKVQEFSQFTFIPYPNLTKVYDTVRGTPHQLAANSSVPNSPIVGLPPANPVNVAKHLTDYKNIEEILITSYKFIIDGLNDMINAKINNQVRKINYTSESLW